MKITKERDSFAQLLAYQEHTNKELTLAMQTISQSNEELKSNVEAQRIHVIIGKYIYLNLLLVTTRKGIT